MYREKLSWSVVFIDLSTLEDRYVQAFQHDEATTFLDEEQDMKQHEDMLRHRFREFIQRFAIYVGKDKKLELDSFIQNGAVIVQELKK